MGMMAIGTAMMWMKDNHVEFERLVQIGYLPAVTVQKAWWEAKAARDAHDQQVFEKKRDYWLSALNDFVVAELNTGHRQWMNGHFDYKVSDFT